MVKENVKHIDGRLKTIDFKLPKIISTCFEPEPVSKIAEENVEKLTNFGVDVLYSADATKWFDILTLNLLRSSSVISKEGYQCQLLPP